jgi:transposase
LITYAGAASPASKRKITTAPRAIWSGAAMHQLAAIQTGSGGFRSDWGANVFAAVRSVIGTAGRRGIDAYQAVRMTLQGKSVLEPS